MIQNKICFEPTIVFFFLQFRRAHDFLPILIQFVGNFLFSSEDFRKSIHTKAGRLLCAVQNSWCVMFEVFDQSRRRDDVVIEIVLCVLLFDDNSKFKSEPNTSKI